MERSSWFQSQFVVTFLWIGFLCAISFMEAPLKFTAPSITREVALEVGHIVFHALNKVEIVLAAILVFMQLKHKPSRLSLRLFSAAATILLIQTAVLDPVLDSRTLARIAGEELAGSHLHLSFVVLETLKLLLLIALGRAQIGDFRANCRQPFSNQGAL